MKKASQSGPWWPFTTAEVHTALGTYGFLATTLAFTGVERMRLAWFSVAFAVLFYVAGLLVHARRASSQLVLIRHGALAGTGHAQVFRDAKRSLFLMHLDDDPPNDELLGLYRRLLDRGVQVRRIVFVRGDASPTAYSWLVEFGDHERLEQRVVLPEQARAVRFSFGVVDTATVVLSVPGWEAIDGTPYTSQLILRHLLLVRDNEVAAVFARVHEETWERATPINSPDELGDPQALVRRCLQRGAAKP